VSVTRSVEPLPGGQVPSGEDGLSAPSPARADPPSILVDGHVHLHDDFAADVFFDAAAANVAAAARELGLPGDTPGMLLLAESEGVDAFSRLADGSRPAGSWRLEPTAEPISLLASNPAGPPLVVVAGRQIVTAEGLEILALGTRARFAEGQPTREALAAVLATEALAVLPWGVGKWTGRRGALIQELLQNLLTARLYAGDNGGRLAWWPRPRLLTQAERCGRPVLAGSDPLPLPAEVRKPGRYGFVAEINLDRQRPFAPLRRWLDAQTTSPRPYGGLERPVSFLGHQIAMQLRKHGRRR